MGLESAPRKFHHAQVGEVGCLPRVLAVDEGTDHAKSALEQSLLARSKTKFHLFRRVVAIHTNTSAPIRGEDHRPERGVI